MNTTSKLQADETSGKRVNEVKGDSGKVGAATQQENAAKMEGKEDARALFAEAVKGCYKQSNDTWNAIAPRVYSRIFRHYAKRVIACGTYIDEVKADFVRIFDTCSEITNEFRTIVKTATAEDGTKSLVREDCKTLADIASSFRNAKTILKQMEAIKAAEAEQRAKRAAMRADLRKLLQTAAQFPQMAMAFAMCPQMQIPVEGTTNGLIITAEICKRLQRYGIVQ
jgi:hypothetical protein